MRQLLPDEVKSLVLAMHGAFPNSGTLDDLTRLDLNTPLGDISPPEAMPELIKRIVISFDTKGRVEELIRAAMLRAQENSSLQFYGSQILTRIARSQPAAWYRPPSDPYETCFVPGPQAFMSRQVLREFIRNLSVPLGVPILVVNGISSTGKTYSFQLPAYIRRAFQQQSEPTYTLARIDLMDEIYSSYEPEMFVKDIAGQLGWSIDSMPKRPSTRYAKELCRWLIGQSNQHTGIIVLVLDGFHHSDLYSETRDTVQELVRQVSANASNLRLLLLNFPDTLLPPSLPGPVQRENLGPLTAAELTEFFSILYQQKGRVPDPNIIDVIVQSILAKVPPGIPNFNELLNKTVTQAAMELK